jgi:hypothetical protein
MYQTNTLLIILSVLAINLAALAQPISPTLVGNNAWQDMNADVWKKAHECGLQIMRIGGEGYDNNLPGATTDWVNRIINDMGAAPIVQIPQNASPDAAAQIVRQYPKVVYYNIGNEPDLALFGAVSVDVVANYVRSKASAMKKANPNIKIYVADCSWYNINMYPKLFSGTGDNLDVSGKNANGNYYVDGLSWHKYPYNAAGALHGQVNTRFVDSMRTSIIRCKNQIELANQKNGRTGIAALGWGIGEFNAVDGNDCWTFENGQMHAAVCGLTMKYEGAYACSWSMWENGGSRGETGFSFFEPGLVPRSSFRHMELVAKNFSGYFLDATDSTVGCGAKTVNDIFSFGCKDTSQEKFCAMIMNRGTAQYAYTVRFDTSKITTGTVKINFRGNCDGEYRDVIAGETTVLLSFTPNHCKKFTYTKANQFKAPDSAEIKFTSGSIRPRVSVGQPKANEAVVVSNAVLRQHNGNVEIKFSHAQNYSVQIVNANGRVVAYSQGSGAVARIPGDKLSTGLCLMRITTPEGVSLKRVMIW